MWNLNIFLHWCDTFQIAFLVLLNSTEIWCLKTHTWNLKKDTKTWMRVHTVCTVHLQIKPAYVWPQSSGWLSHEDISSNLNYNWQRLKLYKDPIFSHPLYVTLPHPRLKPAPKKQTKKWGRGEVIKWKKGMKWSRSMFYNTFGVTSFFRHISTP